MKKKSEAVAEVLPKKAGLMANFEFRGALILKSAEAIEIKDGFGYAKASEVREQARQVIKEVDAEFNEDREMAHRLWKNIVARINRIKEIPEKVILVVESKMRVYLLEEERKHREAEEKARKEAEAEAERERQRLLKAAEKAEAKGNVEAAEIKRMEAETVQAVAPIIAGPEKTVQTASGGTTARKDFTIEIVNPEIFLREVVIAGANYAMVDFKIGKVKAFAEMKRIGDALPNIPGCRVTPTFGFSGRERSGSK